MNSKEIKEWSFDNYGTKNYKISHNYDWEFKEKVLLILADITERLEKMEQPNKLPPCEWCGHE